MGEVGAVRDEGVELSIFSARVDMQREIGEEFGVEVSAGEGAI